MSDTYSILPEHAAPEKTLPEVSTQEYSPTDAERKLLKEVDKKFCAAKEYRAQYDAKWLDYYKMFRGRQWKEQRPSYRHSEVLNLVFQTIQSQVPIITDSRPKFEFLPREPSDFEVADILNEAAEADWTSFNWQYAMTEVIYDGYFYGTGLSGLDFDPILDRIVYKSKDPFYMFPDPSARDCNEDCEYFIEAEPLDCAVIKKRWPEKGRFVKPDLIDLMKGSKTDLGPIRFKSPVEQRTVLEGSSTQDVGEKNKALVVTYYCRSDEYEEDKGAGGSDMGGEPAEPKLKYPNGKKVVVSNGVVLSEGPIPYDDGNFPFQKWSNYILPREFWGISEVEQLEGPQKTFNKLISFVVDVLTLMGNPIWVIDTTAEVDTENLFNRPGQVIEKAPGSEVRREEGVQLQPYVLQLIDRYKEWFDQIAGSNDITRGLNPSGVTAASAIANLQNAAQTRLRQKSQNLDSYLQSLGQMYVSRVFQFYSAPRLFRLTNNEGVNKYFKMHISQDEETGGKTMNVENFTPDGLSVGITQYQVRGEFDVRVTTGSSLPFSKAEKEQRLYGLFDRGIIDAEEVLKGLDYPNYEAVRNRVQQAAAMQQLPPSGGAAPAPAQAAVG
jgi:hypothetical protein